MTLISQLSYLPADQEAPCYRQAVGEVVDAVGEKVQIAARLDKINDFINYVRQSYYNTNTHAWIDNE